MNEVQLEAALVHSDPDSEARKRMEEEIRKIVREELAACLSSALWNNSYIVSTVAEQSFSTNNSVFCDGVLSVIRDQANNPRTFSPRY